MSHIPDCGPPSAKIVKKWILASPVKKTRCGHCSVLRSVLTPLVRGCMAVRDRVVGVGPRFSVFKIFVTSGPLEPPAPTLK